MKTKGRHPDKALSATKVRSLTKPGRHADGNGLYLIVDPSGAKRWLLRTTVRGRRCDIGLGGTNLVTLAEAREKAAAMRKIARDGGDPLEDRRKASLSVPTFSEAAELVHAEHKSTWKNAKHAAQWISTIKTYVVPLIGDRRIDRIETPDILRVLSPIWLTKPETARRVRQRIGTVLDWAKAAGYRAGDNPIDGVGKGLPKQNDSDEHHAALPYAEVPDFIARLKATETGEIAQLAFEFLILTAARTSEVLNAEWSEIDDQATLWTVPGVRMKAKREHRVPLSDRCGRLLARAKLLSAGSRYLFPGRNDEKPMSNMVFSMAIRRMKMPITAHGFRSSFRDWASEATSFPNELAEMALAHTIKNRVEAAYRRGDLLEKRREIMESWAKFVAPARLPSPIQETNTSNPE